VKVVGRHRAATGAYIEGACRRGDQTSAEHEVALQRLANGRDAWLAGTVAALQEHVQVRAAWLVGSLGAGRGDAFSDIDLIGVPDEQFLSDATADPVRALRLPGRVLFQWNKPRDAPAGGAYRGVCVDVAGLPLWVDCYVWPASTAAVPIGGAVLVQRPDWPVPGSLLEFTPLLDRHRTVDSTGAGPADPRSTVFAVLLAAKYLARGDPARADAILGQPGPSGPGMGPTSETLMTMLDRLSVGPGLRPAIAAVRGLVDLAKALTPAESW
jgi:hypothetical protein